MTDEERVSAFMQTWGLEADGIRDDLLALLTEVRAEGAPSTVGVLGEVEDRVRTMLAELSSEGATPAVLAQAKKQIVSIIADALVKRGMVQESATVLAGLLSMAFKVTAKEKV